MPEDVPRRMRRFYREKGEKKEETPEIEVKATGFEAIPTEEELSVEVREKKGKQEEKLLEDIEKALEREKREGKEEEFLIDRRDRAKSFAEQEVRRFREQHNRLPMRGEYEQIVESIFSLMQDEERKDKEQQEQQRRTEREKRKQEEEKRREGRRRGRGRKEEETIELPPEKPKVKLGIEDLEVKEIFGKQEKEGEEEFSLGEGKEELSMKELEEEKSSEEGKCKNCGRATEKQVYCAECGQPYCEKCAKSTKQVGSKLEMVCPNCGEKTRK